MRSTKIFVVEDNDWYRKFIVHILSLNPDFEIKVFSDGKSLIDSLHEQPDIVTLDYRLPDYLGEELLEKIKKYDDSIEVVIISEQNDISTAVNLLKLGANDYLVKTKEIKDPLLNKINRLSKNIGLKDRLASLEEELVQKYEFSNTIIGNSPAMQKIFKLLSKAVKTNITVSIYGETGTGKEVVAKAIHYNSSISKKPFIALNVAAIPSDLFESELFGHEKGSFTGAHMQRKGKFEEANGGTLFLDEIAELDLNSQAKLLRALQEQEIVRIGGNDVIKINTRIIVATHKNLKEEVKKGTFREDLYFRLFGLSVELPPLRERENDVLLLAKTFCDSFCKQNDLETKSISLDAKGKLQAHTWPGNVRELKSIIELACVMSEGASIEPEDIILSDGSILNKVAEKELTLREYNFQILNLYMEKYDQNTKVVADKLGIGQTTVYRMLKEEKGESYS